ncbi:hypothetical protein MWU65_11895 [Cellulophaga sp. F20128]|uniref:hypothetical protein n=1 Tax=Cellulophaga sp. F20128 TaxID=2926413 RepID=UPI001FF0E595|nr:hypothetical protein [Cellulophaga sp. F20128]MCK0157888.1 hypothetical protein [Cellulophaga sp. F20128]
MTQISTNKIPVWFWILSIVALLWNIMGVMAYLADAYMPQEVLTALPATQQELYAARPPWVTAAFAIAVFAGVLGCILLLLRKKLAKTVFLVSLLGVLAQNIYAFFMSNTLEVMGNQALYFPILVILVAIALVIFAQTALKKGWLS